MDGTTAGCCSSNAYFGTLHYRDTLLTVVLFAILGTALGLIVRSTVPRWRSPSPG
jgi:hypothetical protein